MNFLYKASGDIDIKISFDTHEHGDGEPFDGKGVLLFMPTTPVMEMFTSMTLKLDCRFIWWYRLSGDLHT